MKNYKEMSDVETVMIKFEMFNSALQVITNGIESSTSKDLCETMYYIKDVIETFNKELRSTFDAAWEASKEPLQPPVVEAEKKWEGTNMWIDETSSYTYPTTKMSLDDTYDQVNKAYSLNNGFR